jgi:D-alanyl-lipoteichoic acid biosynthesis protein DltD
MNGRIFLKHHVLPFFIAVFFAIGIWRSPLRKQFIAFDKPLSTHKIPVNFSDRVIPECSSHYINENALKRALYCGHLVVMGSSEMSNSASSAIPYNFFNEHKIPSLGVGHEGNQLMSILVQLAAYHELLKNAKITIILSPGWFEGKSAHGTSLQSFLEYADEHILYYIYYDDELPGPIRDHISDYVIKNYNAIDNPSAILRAIYYSHGSDKAPLLSLFYTPFASLHHTYSDMKREIMSDPEYTGMPFKKEGLSGGCGFTTDTIIYPRWDSLRANAFKEFQATATNNPYGIENSYYNTWMRGKDLKKLTIVPDEENQELKDLYVLLKFLEYYNCRTLFVMQPLNPLAVSNIEDLDPVLKKVEDAVRSNGFEYLNLHTSDHNKYQKGILNDYQHFGEAGWYEVDEAITRFFLTPK